MPKYVVYFRVESIETGDIEIEADSPEEAKRLFYESEIGTPIDNARLEAKLSLEDSHDSVVQIDVRDEDNNDLIPVWTESEDGDEGDDDEDAEQAA